MIEVGSWSVMKCVVLVFGRGLLLLGARSLRSAILEATEPAFEHPSRVLQVNGIWWRLSEMSVFWPGWKLTVSRDLEYTNGFNVVCCRAFLRGVCGVFQHLWQRLRACRHILSASWWLRQQTRYQYMYVYPVRSFQRRIDREFPTMSLKKQEKHCILGGFQQDLDWVSQVLTPALKRQGVFL